MNNFPEHGVTAGLSGLNHRKTNEKLHCMNLLTGGLLVESIPRATS